MWRVIRGVWGQGRRYFWRGMLDGGYEVGRMRGRVCGGQWGGGEGEVFGECYVEGGVGGGRCKKGGVWWGVRGCSVGGIL